MCPDNREQRGGSFRGTEAHGDRAEDGGVQRRVRAVFLVVQGELQQTLQRDPAGRVDGRREPSAEEWRGTVVQAGITRAHHPIQQTVDLPKPVRRQGGLGRGGLTDRREKLRGHDARPFPVVFVVRVRFVVPRRIGKPGRQSQPDEPFVGGGLEVFIRACLEVVESGGGQF